ncbi:methyltransferase domain-containing protein [Flagellimonas sp. HMM57]|uniref:methyltransferase domain-containing protein n=1 Tax=unclassified Flagellimonas TaxID=2644544 RepID=UPI001F0A8A45|nr:MULTISPECIES: methyltransferase domain-containing protein [unclassified Flagellimonas]UII75785.1 methyltransferase domain-containing protein [Flagellimonas sp. HMM57]
MDFSVRSIQPEIMDDANLEYDKLSEAYEDINRCNKMLGGDGITINAVWNLIKPNTNKSYTILDMGCGDGEILRKLSTFLDKRGISHSLVGIDLKEDLLRIAKEKSSDFRSLQFKKMDILKADSEFTCDILINTLTMHHFDEDRIDVFLRQFVKLARVGVVINDLQRSKLAYWLFHIFGLFFINTKVAKHDGLVSITKGFRKKELVEFSKNIPNVSHTIQWKWAFRYVWIMNFKRQYS